MADVREFTYAPEWACGKDYEGYWDHWRSLQKWFDENYTGFNRQRNELHAYGQHLYLWNHYFQYFMQQYKTFTSQTLSQQYYSQQYNPPYNHFCDSKEVDEADLAYKNFLKVSMEHKKEREKVKKCVDEMEFVNVSDLPKKQRSLISEKFNSRKEEIKELYGEDGARIHAMETALQLNFERKQDKLRPQVWPQLPLNIVFSND